MRKAGSPRCQSFLPRTLCGAQAPSPTLPVPSPQSPGSSSATPGRPPATSPGRNVSAGSPVTSPAPPPRRPSLGSHSSCRLPLCLEVQLQPPRADGPTVQLLLTLLLLQILPAVGKGWSRRKGGRGTRGLINLIFIERPRCARRCTDHSEDTVPAL